MEEALAEVNSAVFALYTQSQGMDASISMAANYISPYIQGGYWTGKRSVSYQFTPIVAVIDMETGEVLAMDSYTAPLAPVAILDAATQANED
jgi:hypothetical protein